MPLSESLNAQALRELGEEVCSAPINGGKCGRPKKSKQTFCIRCYTRLPLAMRTQLYRSFARGYVDAWVTATDWLRDN